MAYYYHGAVENTEQGIKAHIQVEDGHTVTPKEIDEKFEEAIKDGKTGTFRIFFHTDGKVEFYWEALT